MKYLKTPSLLEKEISFKLKTTELVTVFIDEIQKIPQLLDEVHRCIELFQKKCRFILTGSSARKLRKAHSNLLAGRALYLPFHPFHFNEISVRPNLDKILRYGTLPRAFLENDEELVQNYLFSYTQT